MEKTTKRFPRPILFALGIGLFVGALLILGIRFVNYKPDTSKDVHYHANFAVFINGQREEFKGPQYYQEVAVCSLHGATPLARVHLHDNINNVIHVHAAAVTWADFFTNLGWGIGQNYIASPDQTYTADDANKLNLVLNGKNVTNVTNIAQQVIKDKDRLLVSYGAIDDTTLQQEFKAVGNNASYYDTHADPAACSGAESQSPTVSDRLHHLF
jgi:hypothetical protein